MKKIKQAFTTAELMIALTIIGVVAILILPGLIKDYQKKIYLTKLKKTYNSLSAAVEQACIDNNVSSFSSTPYVANYNKNAVMEFLKTYMKVKSEVSGFVDSYKVIDARNFTEREAEKKGASAIAEYLETGTLIKERNSGVSDGYAKVILNDGQALAMLCESASNNCYIFLDVNGKDEPNTEGRDMFAFRIVQQTNNISDFASADDCLNGQATIGPVNVANGGGCLARIMENNWHMDY